jgi:hypothetical protein
MNAPRPDGCRNSTTGAIPDETLAARARSGLEDLKKEKGTA